MRRHQRVALLGQLELNDVTLMNAIWNRADADFSGRPDPGLN